MTKLLRCLAPAAVLLSAFSVVPSAQGGRGQARPQTPPRDARGAETPAPVGTATITGTVVTATGQPARKVRVNLSSPQPGGGRGTAQKSTTTDDQGRFSFTALPAGRYTLNANKPGHLTVSYGQRRPGTQGTQIELSDGAKFQAQLQIPRGSVITGTILDENGEPALNTQVRTMRYVTQGGRRTLQGSGNGTTDDRGVYRVFGLQPGDYVVCATPRNSGPEFGRIDTQAIQQAIESAAVAAAAAGGGRGGALMDRVTALQATAAAQQPAEDTPSGYAPVCYPGTTASASATPVAVGVGEERGVVDFQLQLVPMARVEGTIVNSTGAELQGLQITLVDLAAQGAPGLGQTVGARPDAEGRFRLNAVAPGQYRLTARGQIGAGGGRGRGLAGLLGAAAEGRGGGGRGAGRGGETAAERPEPVIVWGAADITIDGRNVSNVMLPIQNGMSVSGQIAFEGATPPPADLTRMRVMLQPADPGGVNGAQAAARVDATGKFSAGSVAPGRYRINATGAQQWFVESAMVSGQDALDFPFEVKGGQNVGNITITMTDRQTELTGTVVDGRNQPAVDYTLVIFPADSKYWTGATRRTQTLRPGTDGRYTSRNLPPGEYKIAPVLDLEPGAASDPAFLEQIASSATRVTLAAGEKKTQNIRVSSGQF